MTEKPEGPTPDGHRRALKSVAHDLGNLSYRLTFFTDNLKGQIPDAGFRAEAIALLENTTSRLQQLIEKLRDVEKHV